MENSTFNGLVNETMLSSASYDELFKQPSTLEWIVIFTISVSCAVFNIPVFFVVPRIKNNHIGYSTRYTMIHLAITDFLLGFSCLLFRTIHYTHPDLFMRYLCDWDGRANSILGIVSRMIICFFNVDKLLTLSYPFKYKIWMTRTKAMVTLVVIWFAVTFYYFIMIIPRFKIKVTYFENSHVCLVDYTNNKIFSILSGVLVLFLPLITCVVSFIGIVYILCKHHRSRHHLKEGQNQTTLDMSPFIMLIAITSFYFAMWIPFFTLNLIWKMLTGSTYSAAAEFATFWLIGANSAVNPFIYLATMTSYRRELVKLIKRLMPFTCQCSCNIQLKQGKDKSESSGTAATSTSGV